MAVVDGEQIFIRASVCEKDPNMGTDAFFAEQTLERSVAGASLPQVLTRLVQLVESHTTGMICSILLLDEDGVRLRHAAAPSLPESYVKAIDGMSIGPKAGSCGTAAYVRQTVVVTDILSDPLWDDFRDLAVDHGLRACWSRPIVWHAGEVLGTFAMYYRVPRGPLPEEQRLSEIAVQIAGIAIQNLRAEQALKESEERNRAILQAIPDSMFVLDSDFTYLECQPRSSCRFPVAPANILGKKMHDVLPFELAEKFATSCRKASESGEPQLVEYEFPLNGQTRYSEARIMSTSDGKFLAVVRDITERKLAEEALRKREEELRRSNAETRDLMGRLMTAQEAERRRIARKLYDDLNQKVAALSIIASGIRHYLPVLPETLNNQLDMLHRCAIEIAEGMHQLSQELHPAVLEHVGLAAALKAYVAEFSHVEKLQIDLTVPEDVKPIPPDAAICLYRVAQEGLCNIAKHSGVNYAEVKLSLDDQAVHLHVADSGLGFDLNSARRNGLGLAGMEERLRFVNGNFRISTQPGGGSKLQATIPLPK